MSARPRSQRPERGHWTIWSRGRNRRDLLWVCPCGTRVWLLDRHEMDAEGNVAPRLDCAVCGRDEWLKLADWKEEEDGGGID